MIPLKENPNRNELRAWQLRVIQNINPNIPWKPWDLARRLHMPSLQLRYLLKDVRFYKKDWEQVVAMGADIKNILLPLLQLPSNVPLPFPPIPLPDQNGIIKRVQYKTKRPVQRTQPRLPEITKAPVELPGESPQSILDLYTKFDNALSKFPNELGAAVSLALFRRYSSKKEILCLK